MDVWKIIYYESGSGSAPVKDFIEKLDVVSQNKIADTLDLLEEFGTSIGLPHVRKLVGAQLWELRILGGKNIRIFYVTLTGKSFLLLHAFQKKKQKTDRREIILAIKRLTDYKLRSNN